MKLKIFAVGAIILVLTACFLDDDVITKAPPIDIITVSGVTVTLDGTLVRPCATTAQLVDYLVTESISGIVGIKTETSYTSSDASCTGDVTVDRVIEVTFKKGSVMAITGWLDLAGTPVAPPLAQDGLGGRLLENESVTSLTLTIKSVTPEDPGLPSGTEISAFYGVDDTLPGAPILYGASDNDNQKALNIPLTPQ